MSAAVYPLARISAFFLSSPLYGDGLVPPRVLIALTLAITALLMPTLIPLQVPDLFSLPGLWAVVQEVIIGVWMGLALHFALAIFLLAAQMAGLQMGLGFAQLVDPVYGGQIPLLGQYYRFLVYLLLLASEGHLAMIRTVGFSFERIPIGTLPGINAVGEMITLTGGIFAGAIRVVLPVIIGLFLANFTLGVITRAAPQMNIFSVGFAFLIPLGYLMLLFTLPQLYVHVQEYFGEIMLYISGLHGS